MGIVAERAELARLRGELRSQWAAFKAYCWRQDPLGQEAAAHALGRSLELQQQIENLREEMDAGAGVSR